MLHCYDAFQWGSVHKGMIYEYIQCLGIHGGHGNYYWKAAVGDVVANLHCHPEDTPLGMSGRVFPQRLTEGDPPECECCYSIGWGLRLSRRKERGKAAESFAFSFLAVGTMWPIRAWSSNLQQPLPSPFSATVDCTLKSWVCLLSLRLFSKESCHNGEKSNW